MVQGSALQGRGPPASHIPEAGQSCGPFVCDEQEDSRAACEFVRVILR